ncbi:MAG TPA: hypothetical protein VFA59_23945 [Vicinamibacterales bacterium]|nr:hypothetical protein [Vicinamibacterales bacterium]
MAAVTMPKPAPPPADGGWPRNYTSPSGARIVLYQPQVVSWPDQKHMTLAAAVSYLAKDAPKAALGTVKIESDTRVAIDDRLVSFSEFTITETNFPTIAKEQLRDVVAEINASLPREERVIGLDRVLAQVDTSEVKPKNVDGVKADPPPIFYSESPAILVNFDGEPIWSPIQGVDLKFAVNTNWDVFQYATANEYYLRANDRWLVATSVKGPWKAARKLPGSFKKLPDDGNWADVKASLAKNEAKTSATVPTVFVSTVPAEMILVTGAPTYAPVAGTHLLWISNTPSDVFRLKANGPVFFLVAGRWFSAPSFSGPWTFATPTLPEDFKKIPLEHPRSRVLASVPGTRQALEAVLLAQIPQTAKVPRTGLQAPAVAYTGEPVFEPIPQTTIARAVNTDKDILKVGDLYYMCFQGVWFRSATPKGPWEVADSVPAQVYDIPINSPAHNVTYVTVNESHDDWIEFASAAAYTGMMVAWGCAMWGSGWYYPPYAYGGAYYPHYPTYGYGASYNPWTGAYSRGGAVYGPYGGAGYGARYNPSTGTYARGAVAYGPGGAAGAAQAWNPRTGTYAQTRQGSNVYGSWGSTQVQRGDQWASTSRATNRQTGTTTRATTGSGGGGAITRNQAGPGGVSGAARTAGGDVYAGRDGNVYRNTGSGWQKYDSGGWNSVNKPSQMPAGTTGRFGSEALTRPSTLDSATRNQLNQDRVSRSDGARRTSDQSRYSSSSGSRARSSAGSYRPSGGGMSRGGGARGGGRRR